MVITVIVITVVVMSRLVLNSIWDGHLSLCTETPLLEQRYNYTKRQHYNTILVMTHRF